MNDKMDYQSECLRSKREGLIRTQRNQMLEKAMEYDYLDHQNISIKKQFKNVYENVNDHFSRFIKD